MVRIEGRNPVLAALKGKRSVVKIYLQHGAKGSRIEEIKSRAKEDNIVLQFTEKRHMGKMADSYSHQGVIAEAEDLELYTPLDMIKKARAGEEVPFLILLDQIQDPHNFGAIIRTAQVAGAHGVIYPRHRSADITPAVMKAAAGAVEHIMLSRVTNINYTIRDLKEEGLWIAGADVKGEKEHFDFDLTGPLALVIGNEGAGLRRLVKENCDFLVRIPMYGKPSSLNASVAAGIIIYEIVRQRNLTKPS
ncbi:MAG: 23S rRNA (guanosine(2251)-2'-O)-methyltransferase RlmB [Halanaerobiales bacterium]